MNAFGLWLAKWRRDVAVPSELNFISVCSGGGGLDLAVELACPGARPVLYVERESFAVACLVEAMQAGFLADAPVWSDARTIPGRRFRGCVDGIIGGIPCQPHSLAGKRLAHLDERDLWAPFRKTLVQSGAWWCLIENVGGMLSSGGAERVWRDLRRLGFALEGGLFRASEVGEYGPDGVFQPAPHERERLFILGVRVRPGVGLADPSREGREGCRPVGHRSGERQAAERSGEPLADAGCDGQLRGPERYERAIEPRQQASFGRDAERCDPDLADTTGSGRRRARSGSEPSGRCGQARRLQSGRLGVEVGDASGPRGRPGFREAGSILNGPETRDASGALVNAVGRGRGGRPDEPLRRSEGRAPAERAGEIGLFPPGPGDRDAWARVAELEPGLLPALPQSRFRGVADGLAPRLDQLRLLGNGVVPLEGALAFRTLAARLAARGSAGAALLVRMMEGGKQ